MDVLKVIGRLFEPAARASECAYSPYGGVRIGAGVLDDKGRVHTGCNVENASYGLTQCAERNAMAAAVNAGMGAGEGGAILIYSDGIELVAPCGACRQVMRELLAADALVVSCHREDSFRCWSIADLLPDAFVPDQGRKAC